MSSFTITCQNGWKQNSCYKTLQVNEKIKYTENRLKQLNAAEKEWQVQCW